MSKIKTSVGLFLMAAVLVALPACKKPESQEGGGAVDVRSNDTPPPTAPTSEVPGIDQSASDVNPVQAQSWIDDVKTGKTLGADGVVSDHDKVDFMAGDTVMVSMKVGDAPAGSAVKASWLGPEKNEIKNETKNVNTGDKTMSFQTSTKGWAAGNYEVEIWTGDEKVGEENFILK